jgi:transposase
MPTPIRWACPTEFTAEEKRVAQALHRIGKFYVFLREIRAELFDETFQAELASAYQPRGTAPVPPALLAMVLLLQAYDQVGDAEAVVTAQLDPRWQLALGCVGTTTAPFSQGVLVKFRARMIAHELDRKLLTRTIELAKRTGKFGWQHLQAALDSSPLLGRAASRTRGI